MPFDVAAEPVVQSPANDLAAAFEAGREPEARWAAENPDRALALLFVDPRQCEALDVLLAA